ATTDRFTVTRRRFDLNRWRRFDLNRWRCLALDRSRIDPLKMPGNAEHESAQRPQNQRSQNKKESCEYADCTICEAAQNARCGTTKQDHKAISYRPVLPRNVEEVRPERADPFQEAHRTL